MKKFSLLISLACATVFASCEKPELKAPESDSVITFVAEKPAIDVDTKTAWFADQGKVLWSVNDQIRAACLRDGQYWQAKASDANASSVAKIYASDRLSEACEIARFTFNTNSIFDCSTTGSYQFFAISPAPTSSNFSDAPYLNMNLKSEQNFSSSTFDSAADILVGRSKNLYTEAIDDKTEVDMQFKRLVALSQITFKNLNGAAEGELVKKITLEAQDGAAVSGGVKVDLKEGTIEPNNAVNTVSVSSLNGLSLDANSSLVAWFSTLEFTATSLSVDVETNLAHYKREIDLSSNSKTFVCGKRNLLTINMSSATRTSKGSSSQPTTVEFGNLGYTSWGKTESFSGSAFEFVSQTKDNVTFDYVRNNGSIYANTAAIRFYKSNELTFTAPKGYVINSIVFTGSALKGDVTTNVNTCTSSTEVLSW
ncbi:MAG: fimbrillin family protein, partial [Bacteroidales bacterium]|nr:fimbrillin family protein [Bacteroidales bacterium]